MIYNVNPNSYEDNSQQEIEPREATLFASFALIDLVSGYENDTLPSSVRKMVDVESFRNFMQVRNMPSMIAQNYSQEGENGHYNYTFTLNGVDTDFPFFMEIEIALNYKNNLPLYSISDSLSETPELSGAVADMTLRFEPNATPINIKIVNAEYSEDAWQKRLEQMKEQGYQFTNTAFTSLNGSHYCSFVQTENPEIRNKEYFEKVRYMADWQLELLDIDNGILREAFKDNAEAVLRMATIARSQYPDISRKLFDKISRWNHDAGVFFVSSESPNQEINLSSITNYSDLYMMAAVKGELRESSLELSTIYSEEHLECVKVDIIERASNGNNLADACYVLFADLTFEDPVESFMRMNEYVNWSFDVPYADLENFILNPSNEIGSTLSLELFPIDPESGDRSQNIELVYLGNISGRNAIKMVFK